MRSGFRDRDGPVQHLLAQVGTTSLAMTGWVTAGTDGSRIKPRRCLAGLDDETSSKYGAILDSGSRSG
jgi:hypothetical protein